MDLSRVATAVWEPTIFVKSEISDCFVYLRIPEEEILFREPGSLLAALPDPVRGHDISEQGDTRR
jgi:hypothetical protein